MTVEISNYQSTAYSGMVSNTFKPKFNRRTGQAFCVNTAGQIVANSRLDSREWKMLDTAVQLMVRTRLIGIQHLRTYGLVRHIGSIGVMQVDERVQSERRLADVTMDTQTVVNMDKVDRATISVPLPVISTQYKIGERELEASRRLMLPLDTAEATESARAVAETLESILFNGTTAIKLNGLGVKGYLNAPGSLADTATNMGGGVFITGDNAYNTIKGVIAALELRRYRGPYAVYLNATDWFKLLNVRGSALESTQMDLIMKLPQVKSVEIADAANVPAGTMVVVQLTNDVIELQETLPIQNREWRTDDLSTFYGRVLTMAIPFVKTNYVGQTGIAIISGL